jgi:S-adenosylmethionine-dependent methyltransferase
MGNEFEAGQRQWRARLATLRQVVRQELVSRQIGGQLHGRAPGRALDIGCGQGTQLLNLARRGHPVVGLDSSATLLADLEKALSAESPPVRERVQLMRGDVNDLGVLFAPASFDVVLCHGVLMYFPDPQPVLQAIGRLVAPGGLVSLLVRNGDALALRPGLLGDWAATKAAFDDPGYLNRIGVQARADRLSDLTGFLNSAGLSVLAWYGVRVFTDVVASDAPLPGAEELELILECEERAGRTDPYRAVAALTHVIAVS